MRSGAYYGFFKKAGELIGTITGGTIGGVTKAAGEKLNNDFVKEVGDSVYNTSVNAGKTIGQAADGAAKVAVGTLDDDNEAVDKGIKELGDAVNRTAKGIKNSFKYIRENGIDVIDGDKEKVLLAAKNLAKVAAVSSLAIGIGDYIGIIGDDTIEIVEAEDLDIDPDNILDIDELKELDLEHENITDVGDIEGLDIDEILEKDIDGDGVLDNVDNDVSADPGMHYVEGYFRDDGTYVEGHWKTNPDGDLTNNLG